MSRSRRSVMSTHSVNGKWRRCPICQSVIAQDFEEAVAMDRGALPNEFDAEAVAREVEADHLRRIGALERLDFATSTIPPVASPNDTQPYEPVGFELA